MTKRPVSITILGWIFIAAGSVGLIYHFRELTPFSSEALWISLVRLIAIVAGIFLLRGQDWARWLALLWMAFHVVVSIFHSWSQVAMHALFLIVIAWLLFRPVATAYFRSQHKAG